MNCLNNADTATVKPIEEVLKFSVHILSSDPDVNEQVAVKTSRKRTKKQDRVAKEAKIECGICLDEIKESNAGKPSGCSHMFCVKCITKWAQSHDTCPYDRIKFHFLTIINKKTGELVRQVEKKEKKPKTTKSRTSRRTVRSESNPNLNAFTNRAERTPLNPFPDRNQNSNLNSSHCRTCMSYEHPDMMVTCDTCLSRFHMECLSNANDVEADEWSCRTCRSLGGSDSKEHLVMRNAAVRRRVLQHYRTHNQMLFAAGNGSVLANISSRPSNTNGYSATTSASSTVVNKRFTVNTKLPQQPFQREHRQPEGFEAAQPRDILFEIMRSQEMLFGQVKYQSTHPLIKHHLPRYSKNKN